MRRDHHVQIHLDQRPDQSVGHQRLAACRCLDPLSQIRGRGARHCRLDTLLDLFGIEDPALRHLARIVRGADTGDLGREPQPAGLLAISLGLSSSEDNDLAQLEKGMVIYDALFARCRHATAEKHTWTSRPAAS